MTEPVEQPYIEADDYDAAEQQAAVDDELTGAPTPGGIGLEVPDADAAEQAAELPADEDDDYPA
ncbi:MAG: hypothetical protein GEU83_12385 [Pseudonocardiaceae bacterium]|nr:hypothetical protein [Pseudonocardiaceae bacterium]